jgi:hypothetical protein
MSLSIVAYGISAKKLSLPDAPADENTRPTRLLAGAPRVSDGGQAAANARLATRLLAWHQSLGGPEGSITFRQRGAGAG